MKSKSTAYKIIQAILLTTIMMLLPIAAWAQETTLTTVVPSSHTLHIELTGDGTIIVDGVAYTQSADIQIRRKNRPEISLQITDGNKVKTVFYGSENITEAIKNGSWIMPEVTEDVSLSVAFEKISSIPQTGDNSQLVLWMSLLTGSALCLTFCIIQARKNQSTK